jgi:predicted transcriptional regulator
LTGWVAADISAPEVKPPDLPFACSKRERQVIEVISRLGRATAREIERELPNAPTYSAVRSILRVLTTKGVLIKEKDAGGRDWYAPAVSVAQIRKSAVREFVSGFFANSAVEAACALLGQRSVRLTKAEADKLIALIKEARKS